MPLKLIRTVVPAAETVSDTEQKLHAKIDLTDDDDLVTDLNTTAREYISDVLTRSFVDETFELYLDEFPPSPCPIVIPRVPLSSITSITYVDTAGATQTLAADQYIVEDKGEPGSVHRAFNVTWPTTRVETNAIKVTFVAGHGAAASDVPEKFKTLIKHYFTHLYEHREPVKDKTWVELPLHLEALIEKYALRVFG